MGVNFFYHKDGTAEPQHIGQSSAGWCFCLRLYPDDGIQSLEKWRELFAVTGSFIKDEYGASVTLDDMDRIITKRGWQGGAPDRHPIDGRHCVGHGAGTWDHFVGNFS